MQMDRRVLAALLGSAAVAAGGLVAFTIPGASAQNAASAPAEVTEPQAPSAGSVLNDRMADKRAEIVKLMDLSGAKLTALGKTCGGLDGYLAEAADGKVQTIYVTADGQHLVAGLCFDADGKNVTTLEIGAMKARMDANKVVGKTASAENANPAPQAQAVTLDKEQFLAAVDQVPWFAVGPVNAPVIYMIADPNCPVCHRTWQTLEHLVQDRKAQVRVILINGLGSSHDDVVSILTRDDPGKAWLAGEGSRDGVEIAPAPDKSSQKYAEGTRYAQMNMGVVEKFGVTKTPFLAFIAKDSKLYVADGAPADIPAFFNLGGGL